MEEREIKNIWMIEDTSGGSARLIITGEKWFFSLEQALQKTESCLFIRTTGVVGTEGEIRHIKGRDFKVENGNGNVYTHMAVFEEIWKD